MQFIAITQDPNNNPNPKFAKKLTKLKALLTALEAKDLPLNAIGDINSDIAHFNRQDITQPKLHRQVCKLQNKILKKLERQFKIVPKHYYRDLWMILGMSAFGIPLGVAFGASLGNMAFIGTLMPVGMVIGIAVGTVMDNKAEKEGRQLNFKKAFY